MNIDKPHQDNDWLQMIRQRVESMSHGSVEIAIYDSKVVQLDTTRKWRLPQSLRPQLPKERSRSAVVAKKQNASTIDFHAAGGMAD